MDITLEVDRGGQVAVRKLMTGEKVTFQCKLCSDIFPSESGIKVHHAVKHMKIGVTCDTCGMSCFESKEAFEEHVEKFHFPDNHEGSKLECRACGRKSKDKKALFRHIKESHRDKKFPCLLCGFQFTRPENLKVHLQFNHGPKDEIPTFDCKECGKTFSAKTTLRSHIRTVHRNLEVFHPCEFCGKQFKLLQVLRVHVRFVHEKSRNHKCKCCTMEFATAAKLKRHRGSLFHKQQKKFASSDDEVEDNVREDYKAQRLARRRRSLASGPQSTQGSNPSGRRNSPTRRPKKSKSEPNPINKRGPGRPAKIKALQAIAETCVKDEIDHMDIKPIVSKTPLELKTLKIILVKCDAVAPKIEKIEIFPDEDQVQIKIEETPSAFSEDFTATDLILRLPDEPPSHFCMYCDAGFVTIDKVSTHEKMCEEYMKAPKYFGCSFPGCEKSYNRAAPLRNHMKIHSTERPLKCSDCSLTYKSSNALKSHMDKVHRGKPSYWDLYKMQDHSVPCERCKKVFSTPKGLARHMEEIHDNPGQYPYKCTVPNCPRAFKRRNYLNDHIELDHDTKKHRWECAICSGSVFNREWKYKNHLTRARHRQNAKLAKTNHGRKKLEKKQKRPTTHLMLSNIPENEEGLKLAKKIMEILIPHVKVGIGDIRVGKKKESKTELRPRPLRVILPSVYYRGIGLKNAHLLKQLEDTKNVKVTKGKRKNAIVPKKLKTDEEGIRVGKVLRLDMI